MGEGKAQTKDENHACKVMGDFSFCPGEKILYPLKRERVEGILIPAEGKLAPDGWTKPRSRDF